MKFKKRYGTEFLVIALIAVCAVMMTGCSLMYSKPGASKVEKIVQECINDKIKSASLLITSDSDSGGKEFIYSMVDENGVEFTVKVDNKYMNGFVVSIPYVYSGYIIYSTDYLAKVLQFYDDDINDILDKDCVIEYSYIGKVGPLEIVFEPGTDYSEIAEVLLAIDERIDLNYSCNYSEGNKNKGYCIDNSSKKWWRDNNSYDVLVEMDKTDNEDKTSGSHKIWSSFKFSDKHENTMTYDTIIEKLEKEEY